MKLDFAGCMHIRCARLRYPNDVRSDPVLTDLLYHLLVTTGTIRQKAYCIYCNPGNFSKLINLVNLRFWHVISY